MIIGREFTCDTVFGIPCDHPAVKDGLLHCIPSFFETPHMHDCFGYVLVATNKIIEELRLHNPDFLQHADYKFRAGRVTAATVESWVKRASAQHPLDMGFWAYVDRGGSHRQLAMSSGFAGMIRLVQELKLPCFPIAVEKSFTVLINEIFGYSERDARLLPARAIQPKSGLTIDMRP